MGKYDFGGQPPIAVNILRLISELEGSSQMLKYMGFEEDMNAINEMKKRYYKLSTSRPIKKKRQKTMACSTTAVQLTVNQWVAGSNPATPVDKN